MHERLLGDDYPLFAIRRTTWSTPSRRRPTTAISARGRARSGGGGRVHVEERAVERVRHLLDGLYPTHRRSPDGRAAADRVASHDLKFFSRLLEQLQSMPELEIRVDAWPALDRHDPERVAS